MSNEERIKSEIDKRAKGIYRLWTIGVTDRPAERKEEHGKPEDWHQWNADTEEAARTVEKHFIDKGMKGGTGGTGKADYVYIF